MAGSVSAAYFRVCGFTALTGLDAVFLTAGLFVYVPVPEDVPESADPRRDVRFVPLEILSKMSRPMDFSLVLVGPIPSASLIF